MLKRVTCPYCSGLTSLFAMYFTEGTNRVFLAQTQGLCGKKMVLHTFKCTNISLHEFPPKKTLGVTMQ